MIRVENLSKHFGERTLFKDITYHFPANERIALIGANGAGKTTLLRILCGEESSDTGQVVKPGSLKLGYLPQKPNPNPKETVLDECLTGAEEIYLLSERLAHLTKQLEQDSTEAALHAYEEAETKFRTLGGYSIEAEATKILTGLGFKEEQLPLHPIHLSGGWRMRLELAKILLRQNDFLVLDEPTNHLDLPSLVWVENYLQNFRGTLLFVSHDRALLNRLSSITLHLAGNGMTPYKGNFDAFLIEKELREEQEAAQLETLRKKREAMEQFVTRFGAKASKASQAQSKLKMIARLKSMEDSLDTQTFDATIALAVAQPQKTPKLVYSVKHAATGYEQPLMKDINIDVMRGQKIAVIGANGIGKSTLIKTIAGKVPPLAGEWTAANELRKSYFAQDQSEVFQLQKTLLENLLQHSTLSEKEARQLLGSFLFRGDDVFKQASVLSGGELSRLGLACALAQQAGLLLLDEPTNHLDMSSIEILSLAVSEYEGTVMFVSHDRSFINGVCTHVLAIAANGDHHIFEGKLEDYERLAAVAGFPNVLQADSDSGEKKPKGSERSKPQSPQRKHQEDRALKKQIQQVEKKQLTLEQKMESCTNELSDLEIRLVKASEDNDLKLIQELTTKIADKQSQLTNCETEWMELGETLERLKN